MQCRDSIREYFGTKHAVTDPGSVEAIAEGYEQFKQATMEYFRGLLQQSEQIIERVKALEPPGARELDTDKIITLLENLRTYFESQTESENCELKKQHSVLAFDRELGEVRAAIRAEGERLERGRGQYGESLADAQRSRIAFEEHATALQDVLLIGAQLLIGPIIDGHGPAVLSLVGACLFLRTRYEVIATDEAIDSTEAGQAQTIPLKIATNSVQAIIGANGWR
uniref:Uncharacterized protein n=1 Tax=Anopheles maculatus TaxID=74869 RepID=A0A182SN00_9DIPT